VLHVRVLVPRRQRPALVGEQPASLGVVGVSQLGGDARKAQRVRVDVTRRAAGPARNMRRSTAGNFLELLCHVKRVGFGPYVIANRWSNNLGVVIDCVGINGQGKRLEHHKLACAGSQHKYLHQRCFATISFVKSHTYRYQALKNWRKEIVANHKPYP